MKFVLVIAYLILTVLGLVFMKLGGNPGSLAIKEGTISLGMSLVSGVGFICYLCSFLLFTRIVPSSGVNNPQIIFIVVLFPAPFGPKNPKISPSLTSRLMLLRTFTP